MSSEYEIELGVSDFVAVANQTLEYAYPSIAIVGELANFRISKNRWVYFDLKDESASLRFFGTVYQIKAPLEDGMMLRVRGAPRLHPQFGFSVTVQQVELVGEGSIKRAASLLERKLTAEGLFEPSRKRSVLYPPKRIGLIASGESAAYADFVKIIRARWTGLEIIHADVQVQGADAPDQIVAALQAFNQQQELVDALVITRGGGSAEDLQAFSAEPVVRAVAGSRIPTIIAIGHERDVSLAERAADIHASTPSNAAELLTPDKQDVLASLDRQRVVLDRSIQSVCGIKKDALKISAESLTTLVHSVLSSATDRILAQKAVLDAYNPADALARGYAFVRVHDTLVRRAQDVSVGAIVELEIQDAYMKARIEQIDSKEE